ncbi:serine hydrolase domain-containing protein [Streptomyces aidingensis]|uniref:CubicO group peptidase, beta-lactamase class C family n=1 Tax=Streptomyces aidingensis TaxID=910347 RepID=A0A1I1IKQ0_9ACTN|nr:serine hydrolase domain-containing protein [Streptomyces aidingensis]SFC36807.1 CubicO group peptidase, beta-lactamase class C family [Streptomyces aidingensis]
MSAAPPGEALRPLLATAGAAPGRTVAVAAVHHGRRFTACAGPAGRRTRFEAGSLTKTYTALLLAVLAAEGRVRLTDPLARHLPGVPETSPPVTLLHLATHTSGLPRLPPGLPRRAAPLWFSNPYARFSAGDLERALARVRPRHRPGTRVHYSNFGVALLGRALAQVTGRPYEEALHRRVLGPLGLTGSDCSPDRPQITGHWHGRPRPRWLIPGLPAAGALRLTAADALRSLTLLLDPALAPGAVLRTALAEVQRPRLVLPRGGHQLCLVWNRRPGPPPHLHHSGATRGCTAFLAFSPERGTGLAAFTNTSPGPAARFLRTAYGAFLALARGGP